MNFLHAQYKEIKIPEKAISACGGWWAGAGNYFYLIREGNALKIIHAWQD